MRASHVTGLALPLLLIAQTVTVHASAPLRIHDIQGAAHISPHLGETVADVFGIVTALRSNGFYLQDPQPDDSPATSEGIFVFTSSAPKVAVGDRLQVSGKVSEFRSGGATSTNLTTTEIDSPSITTVSNNNPLPDPVVLGAGGRLPPTSIVEDDATGNVESSGVFDPDSDGIDFYESLEGMRVQVNNAVVVGPTQVFGSGSSQNSEIDVLGDNGAGATIRSVRGGILARATDFNPERIIFNDLISAGPKLPASNVSDTFPGATVGVMDYSFGNYKLEVTGLPAAVSGGLPRTLATPKGPDELTVAGFNVENLSPNDPPVKFATLASLIVTNLGAPDLISVEEIQDDNGATDNGVVDATTTYSQLIDAISAASPEHVQYAFRQIDPVNDQDGGQPGGNIRQGFLFRSDRGLAFVDRGQGTSLAPTTVVTTDGEPHLSLSPGRVDPTNSAWTASRKPLAGEFTYNGTTLFVIANHLIAKSGDDPLFGRDQPPIEVTKPERLQQAQVLHDFVGSILSVDPSANVVVLGDLNDFQFSDPLMVLTGSANGGTPILTDLVDSLSEDQRYSYDFQGNSETLDHILTSANLTARSVLQPIHVNAEFADQASDHDPMLVRIHLPDMTPPQISASVQGTLGGGGWYTSSVQVTWTVTDAQSRVSSQSGCAMTTLSADTPGTTLTCTAVSTGGHASKSVTVKIDRTPPELFSQFDPLGHDLQVSGRDAGSGVPGSAIAPVAVHGGNWTADDDADDDHTWSVLDTRALVRTYLLADVAGNSVTLTVKVRVASSALKARDQTLQYNAGATMALPRAVSRFDWSPATGSLRRLSQEVVVAGTGEGDRQAVGAEWNVNQNVTSIHVTRLMPESDTTRPGLALLRLATAAGKLHIEV